MGHWTFVLFVFTAVCMGQISKQVHSLDGASTKISKAVGDTSSGTSGDGTIHNNNPKHPDTSDIIMKNNTNITADCEDGSINCTEKTFYGRMMGMLDKNKAMLLRTLYVLIALTSIVVVYFMVRAFRLRHKRNKSRKYGLITAPNDLEMAPLDQEEDDEDDMTVFELNGGHKR